MLNCLAVLADELDRQRALAWKAEIGGAVLIAEGVAAYNDRLGPARHEARHVFADDRLAEDDAAQYVADRAVRRLPHFLEAEFLNPLLIRRNRGAFDADAMFLDGVSRVNGDLIGRCVAVLDAEVVIFDVEVKVGMDQLGFDEIPDDACHLVAVEVYNGVCHFDLSHECLAFWEKEFAALYHRILTRQSLHGRLRENSRRRRRRDCPGSIEDLRHDLRG